MIQIKHIKKSFGSRIVLDDISISLAPGEITFVMGKSGVGKSVLLKQIVGLLASDEGEIWVDEDRVTGATEEALTRIRKECGMVFQFPALLDSLTVYDNLVFGMKSHQMYPTEEETRQKALEKLSLVGLGEELFSKYPQELSYGMQKRVSIARTLATEPRYLLFDEPTTSLDPVITRALNQLIKKLSKTLKVTSVVVSHDMECAFEIADRVIVLENGKIVVDCKVGELRESPVPLVKAFIEEMDRYGIPG